jgi:FkbM family methyltransferase
MTLHRFLLGLKSFGRIIEIIRCFRLSRAAFRETLAYLQLCKLEYPYTLHLQSGVQLELQDWQDLTTAWVVFYGNEYEIHPSDSRILDCGANIGAFSLLCSARLKDVRVVGIEPFPSTFKRFVHAIEQNGLSEKITPLNAAVVGTPGTVFMDDAKNVASHSRKVGGRQGIEVEGMTIEMILDQAGFTEVDLLKVDVEGAEYKLFAETPDSVLRRCQRIGLEYHSNGDSAELFKKLEAAGFAVARYPKKGKAGVVEFIRK